MGTKQLMQEKESKKKWVDQNGFAVHLNASLPLREDYGVVASGPYGEGLGVVHGDDDKSRWVGPRWGVTGDRQLARSASGVGGAAEIRVRMGARQLAGGNSSRRA